MILEGYLKKQMLLRDCEKDAVGAVRRPIGSNMGSMQSRFSVNLYGPETTLIQIPVMSFQL